MKTTVVAEGGRKARGWIAKTKKNSRNENKNSNKRDHTKTK